MHKPSSVQIIAAAIALALGAAAITGPVSAGGATGAQQAGFTRVMLQDQDLSTAGKHVVQARAEFQPGVASGRHTHPGEEVAYVLEGQLEVTIDGKPLVVAKAGETFFIPAGAVHEGKNIGTTVAKVLGTYIVDKGKPLSTPAK
jgi:quercetin dioxygenase-like cupin family protein